MRCLITAGSCLPPLTPSSHSELYKILGPPQSPGSFLWTSPGLSLDAVLTFHPSPKAAESFAAHLHPTKTRTWAQLSFLRNPCHSKGEIQTSCQLYSTAECLLWLLLGLCMCYHVCQALPRILFLTVSPSEQGPHFNPTVSFSLFCFCSGPSYPQSKESGSPLLSSASVLGMGMSL